MNTVYSLPCRHQIDLENKNFKIPLSQIGSRWHLDSTKEEDTDCGDREPATSNSFEKVDDAIAKTIASITAFFNEMPDNASRLQFARDVEAFLASKKDLQEPVGKPDRKMFTKGKHGIFFYFCFTLQYLPYTLL